MTITRRRLLLSFIFFTATLFFGCKKDKKTDNPILHGTFQLSGASEVPPVSGGGSGTIDVSYDPSSKIISYDITWQLGSNATTTTGMHFHGAENGSATTSSPIEIPVTGFTTASSGTFSGSTQPLTQMQENELLAGKWYFNIHSSVNPGGEMRGNIIFSATTGSTTGGGVKY